MLLSHTVLSEFHKDLPDKPVTVDAGLLDMEEEESRQLRGWWGSRSTKQWTQCNSWASPPYTSLDYCICTSLICPMLHVLDCQDTFGIGRQNVSKIFSPPWKYLVSLPEWRSSDEWLIFPSPSSSILYELMLSFFHKGPEDSLQTTCCRKMWLRRMWSSDVRWKECVSW